MREFITRIFIVSTLLILSLTDTGNACTVGRDNCQPGNGQTSGCCGVNLYCETPADNPNGEGQCSSCSSGAPGYPYSEQSNYTNDPQVSNSLYNCYHKCKTESFTNGTKVPEKQGKKVYVGTKIDSVSGCNYTIKCNGEEYIDTAPETYWCDGYHLNDYKTACEANRTYDYNRNTFKLYHYGSKTEFRIACGDKPNTIAVETGEKKCGHKLVECIPTEATCKELNDTYGPTLLTIYQRLLHDNNSDTEPTENAMLKIYTSCTQNAGWTTDGIYYPKPNGNKIVGVTDNSTYKYEIPEGETDEVLDVSQCRCQKTTTLSGCDVGADCGVRVILNTDTNGHPTETRDDGKIWPDDYTFDWEHECTANFVSKCEPGFCVWGDDDNVPYADAEKTKPNFGKTPNGYYSDGKIGNAPGNSGTKCIPCPAGATSHSDPDRSYGAKSVDECFMQGDTTKFCEGTKCLTLPALIGKLYPATKSN